MLYDNKTSLSLKKVHETCYNTIRAEFPLLSSQMVIKCEQAAASALKSIKSNKHNNALSQVPFYEFKRILTYKAPLSGKQVETVSPMYTSQMDCRTNNRDGERRGRRYICADGVVFDSDWNASINIGQRSNHPVSSSLPIEGQLVILTGREMSTSQSTHFINEVVSSTPL